ncbi:MAG: hypothetical protein AAF958_05200 [Planctomycetota bacterium]
MNASSPPATTVTADSKSPVDDSKSPIPDAESTAAKRRFAGGRRRFVGRRRRLGRGWRYGMLALVLIGVPAALPLTAIWLDQSDSEALGETLVVLADNAEVLQAVADHARTHPNVQVYYFDWKPRRIVRLGLAPPQSVSVGRDLEYRGLDKKRFHVISASAVSSHSVLREYDRFFASRHTPANADTPANGDTQVTLVVSPTRGRYWKAVIGQTLDPDRAAKFDVVTVDIASLSPTRWFRSHLSGKMVLSELLQTAFVYVNGESQVDPHDPYADLLERQ